MRQAARTYFETQITTTSQGQILIMLYDGAIKFLTQAKERIAVNDYAGKGVLISNAIDIVNELASSLNPEKGGDLSANLGQLYFYCNKRLFMANSRMDTVAIDEVIKILGGLRSAYAQIIDTPEAVAAMAKAPAPTGNPMRSPIGTQAAPAGGAPVPTARAHSAYATQGANRGTAEETAVIQEAEEEATAFTQEIGVQETLPAPAVETAFPAAPAPVPLDRGDDMPKTPPPLSSVKRMAASNLYKKFAS